MKMLMIIADEASKEELEVVLSHSGVIGYTEISPVAGMGSTGPRMGSGAFPRHSAIILTMLEESAVEEIARGIGELGGDACERCHLVAWDVEQLR